MKEIIINVDAYNENSIRTVEGDNLSEVYKIYILKNKRRIDLTNKIAVMAYVDEYGSKRSNILNLNITNAAEGEIELPITNIISEHNGVYACQVAIYGENNSLEQTAPFSLIVENNIFSKISNTAINSTDFHILSEAIKTTNSYAEKLKQGTENIELQYADKLNEKMNKDDVLSMANMGQDVKEAMTGGSVAVVGENAVDTINLRDESVTSSKTTDVGSNAHIALNGTLNIDYKNRKYIFPDNTHGMLFWKNKRYDIPANTTIELVDQYECSSLWFNTTTKTFISRGYVIPPDLEDEILICVVNNGTVQCICDVSYNGEIYKPKGLKIGMDNITPLLSNVNVFTEGVVDFNYTENKVIIPNVKIFINRETYDIKAKEINLLANAHQVLCLNCKTKDIEILPFDITAPVNYRITDTIVILALFDRMCNTVTANLPYIKNGIDLQKENIQTILSLNGTLNIDYKNRKYIFPDNTGGMLFYKNKRYDIPRGLTIELVDQYSISTLWFDIKTQSFISRGYGVSPNLQDEILICVVNNGTVQCICDVSYNGEIYKPKGLKIGMDNIMPVANYYNFYTNGVVDFNYNKNKVIIPDIKIFVGKNTFSFNSKELSLLDNANQILVFNNNTKELELVPFDITAPINYKVVDSNVILAMFDRLCTTIITDLPYIKNGIEFIEPGLKLKDYYSTENEKVEEKLLDDTTGDFTFGCITDIHHNKFFDATQEIMAFNKFSKDNMLDFRFCFGDMIDGFIDKETDYRDIKKVMSVFKEAGDNFAIARGNHDTGFIGYTKPVLSDTPKIDDIVSKKAWDSLTCTHLGDRAVFDEKNPTGGYFYIDFKKYKIRVIVLNTSDFEVFNESGKLLLNPMNCYIKPRQIEWFGDVALKNVERDYAVLVISHANLDTRGDSAYGSMEAQKILNGFKTGTTVTIEKNNVEIPKLNYNFNFDFTEQGSREVICCLSGHSHYDRVLEKDGIKYISINNASPSKTDSQYVPEGAEVFDRARDSLTESSFDIIRIDKKNKKILLKRFGAGHDREINY